VVDGDIGKQETAVNVVEAAIPQFGTIDVLVNNAGILRTKPFTDFTTGTPAAVARVGIPARYRTWDLKRLGAFSALVPPDDGLLGTLRNGGPAGIGGIDCYMTTGERRWIRGQLPITPAMLGNDRVKRF
jgi:hypothetical protein